MKNFSKFNGMKRTAVFCAAVTALSSLAVLPNEYGLSSFSVTAGAAKTGFISLSAETAEQGVYLKWDKVENALDYEVYRARCNEKGEVGEREIFEKIAVVRGTEYTDRSARGDEGKYYAYKICPRFKEGGEPVRGDFSETAFALAGLSEPKSFYESEDDDITPGEGTLSYAPSEGEGDYIYDDVYFLEEEAEEITDYDEYDEYEDDVYPGEGIADSGITAGTLTAGEWKDNENFKEYRKVMSTDKWKDEYDYFKIKTERRHKVTVTDAKGEAVENALVTLKSGSRILGRARTDNKGVAYVYYNIYGRNEIPSKLEITAGKEKRTVRISKEFECNSFEISLKGEYKAPEKALDLMFMIDTTGSMGDELEYLQAEFLDVIDRVDRDNPGLSKRVSMNFYRDHGDDYVIRDFEFTDDMKKASAELSAQEADGGGDYAEAVELALENAVSGHAWREDSVKIMFMVLDAPAHSSEEITRSLVRSAEKAAAAGIRIIPIVSSGAEFDVEYLMRTMAVISGGTYVYLTDESGVGYSHLAPTIPEETEDEKLNELMIRVINEYLE
ncbi:MAG: VWA domain-containing protein [Ruminococcus sp.]|nr:VWA domain-containing protein [Ruminococcus sp.]